MDKKNCKIAVVGATGNVGRVILSILAEKNFPPQNIAAVASAKSVNQSISYGEKATLKCHALADFDFTNYNIALFSPGSAVSAVYAPKAAMVGCTVIDNTSYFRTDPDIPLVIPEINIDSLAMFRKKNIIANPNCTAIQLLMALNPLHKLAPIKRVIVSTYQSVSGAGKAAMDELYCQTRAALMNESHSHKHFNKPIAFNVIPQIDDFMKNGETKEEWKIAIETKKIMEADIKVTATCVRVPVFIGHGVAANVEFSKPIGLSSAKQALKKAPGLMLIDNPEQHQFVTPIECVGEDQVFISRLRVDTSVENGLSMWIIADNIRKGAALNAVQIAENLIKDYL